MIPINVIESSEQRWKEQPDSSESAIFSPGESPLLTRNSQPKIINRVDHLRRTAPDAASLPSDLASASNSPSFAPIDNQIDTTDGIVLERILGKNDLMSVNFLDLGIKVSRAVSRIVVRSGSGRLLGYGTGFLVSPQLLLTNNHVLASKEVAQHSRAEFNYQAGLDWKLLPKVQVSLAPDRFFATDKALDFSLVAVDDDSLNVLEEYGVIALASEEDRVIIGEYVNIIQHPNGEPKQLALRENQVVQELDHFLHYRTDTAPGSSGSPVFNDQWEIVALHHSGIPRRDAQGHILDRDGNRWKPHMGDHRIDWIANEGVRISSILDYLSNETFSSRAEELYRQLVEHG